MRSIHGQHKEFASGIVRGEWRGRQLGPVLSETEGSRGHAPLNKSFLRWETSLNITEGANLRVILASGP